MERSAKHKGSSERVLLVARAKLSTLIENEEISSTARAELEEVAALIRQVELSVGQKRIGESRQKHPSLDFLLQEGIVEGALQHREQLLQLYTDCDLAAAEGNRAISPKKALSAASSSLPGDRASRNSGRRLSTQELDARVAEVLNSDRVTELLDQAGTLDFDAPAFAELVGPTTFVCVFASLEERLRLIKQVRDLGQISNATEFHAKLIHFMDRIGGMYQDTNPYHNSAHAVDVVMTLEWFFRSEYLQTRTSPLDHLISLTGGAIHDVGHPGQNNMFHKMTLSPWAIRYNDKSILENMHVSLSFEIMQNDLACNWFGLLPTDFRKADGQAEGKAEDAGPGVDLQQYVRKALVQMILATDMVKHQSAVQDLNVFVEEHSDPSSAPESEKQLALENKLFTLDTILHAADISNPARPRPIMLKWTQRILTEFWAQGDEEKRLGLSVSPLCDRETEQWAVPKGQLGFIKFVVTPLYSPLAKLMPEVRTALDHLQENVAFWEEQNAAKASHEQLFGAK